MQGYRSPVPYDCLHGIKRQHVSSGYVLLFLGGMYVGSETSSSVQGEGKLLVPSLRLLHRRPNPE